MKRGTPEHPKVGRLMRALGVPRYAAAGLLELLWHFAAKFARSGDLRRFHADEIAEAVSWEGDARKLLDGLVEAGWLDRDGDRLTIHDWSQHADDGIHNALARAGERFADGTAPRLTRLSKAERSRAEEIYAAPSDQQYDEQDDQSHGTRTTHARHTHDMLQEPARHAPATRTALPCPAPPRLSPAPPSPATPDAEPPAAGGGVDAPAGGLGGGGSSRVDAQAERPLAGVYRNMPIRSPAEQERYVGVMQLLAPFKIGGPKKREIMQRQDLTPEIVRRVIEGVRADETLEDQSGALVYRLLNYGNKPKRRPA